MKLVTNLDPIVLLSDTLIDTSIITLIITLLSHIFGAAVAATCVRGLRHHTSYILKPFLKQLKSAINL